MPATVPLLFRLRALLLLAALLCCLPLHADDGDGDTVNPQPLIWLKSAQYAALDHYYGDRQRGYEGGSVTEQALFQGYRDLYEDADGNAQYFDQWVQAFPKSYAARSARGSYYYRMAWVARGHDYAQNTPQKQFDAMRHYEALAQTDLLASLPMTGKPYISTLYLLNVAMFDGKEEERRHWLDLGNQIDPGNFLLRRRYMVSLMPRWYGSYPRMRGFLEECRRQHLPEALLARLDAIIHTDMAKGWSDAGNDAAAYEQWQIVLELSKVSGEPPPADSVYAYTRAAWILKHREEADRGLAQLEGMHVQEGWMLTQMSSIYVEEQRMPEAWSALHRAAALNEPWAQYLIGKTIYLGCVDINQAADPDAAMAWFQRAADQGLAPAKGVLRLAGWGHIFSWLYLNLH